MGRWIQSKEPTYQLSRLVRASVALTKTWETLAPAHRQGDGQGDESRLTRGSGEGDTQGVDGGALDTDTVEIAEGSILRRKLGSWVGMVYFVEEAMELQGCQWGHSGRV